MIWYKDKDNIYITKCASCGAEMEGWELNFRGDILHCGICDERLGMEQDLPDDLSDGEYPIKLEE